VEDITLVTAVPAPDGDELKVRSGATLDPLVLSAAELVEAEVVDGPDESPFA
jgi:hypothetical protein